MNTITYFEKPQKILKSRIKILKPFLPICVIFIWSNTININAGFWDIIDFAIKVAFFVVGFFVAIEILLTPFQIQFRKKVITLTEDMLIVYYGFGKKERSYSLSYSSILSANPKQINSSFHTVTLSLRDPESYLQKLNPTDLKMAQHHFTQNNTYIVLNCNFLEISEYELANEIQNRINANQ